MQTDLPLAQREIDLLLILARSSDPLSLKEISQARGDLKPHAENYNNQVVNRLIGRGLTHCNGRYRKTYELSEAGINAARQHIWTSRDRSVFQGPIVATLSSKEDKKENIFRSGPLFEPSKFSLWLTSEMQRKNTIYRDLAILVGVSQTRIYRIAKGEKPSVDVFFRILHWSGRTTIEIAEFV